MTDQEQFQRMARAYQELSQQFDSMVAQLQTMQAAQGVAGQGALRGLRARVESPDTFDGMKPRVSDWAFQVRTYFSLVTDITEDSKVSYIISLLRDTALSWYRIESNRNGVARPATAESFLDTIKEKFEIVAPQEHARNRLAKLKQTGSVYKYTRDFQSIVLLIPDIDQSELLDRYRRGLKPAVQKEVILRDARSCAEAIKIAERFDSLFYLNSPSQSNGSFSRDYGEPMEIGNMNASANRGGRGNFGKRNSFQLNGSRTPASRDQVGRAMRDMPECYRCHKKGHFSRDHDPQTGALLPGVLSVNLVESRVSESQDQLNA